MSGRRLTRIGRALAVAAVVGGFATLPSSAAAAPPSNDNFSNAFIVNGPGTTLPRNVSYNGTTVEATPETGEPNLCNAVSYGASVWFEIHPDRPGTLEVYLSAPFLAFEAVLEFSGNNYNNGPCDSNTAVGPAHLSVPNIKENQGYKIQIGGYDSDGAGGVTPPSTGTYTITIVFHPDTDRDGFLDDPDSCPLEGGADVAKYRGCPDNDGDTVPEGSGGRDKCPGLNGYNAAKYDGCPDNDKDEIAEGVGGSDRCPGQAGYKADEHLGCPDNDRDGVPEGPGQADRCPGTNPDTQGRPDRNPKDGCSDHITIRATASWLQRTTSNGVKITRYFKLTNVPQGAKVSIACKLPSGRKCPGGKKVARTKKAGTVSAKKLKGKRPSGTQIIVSVTASNATSRYIRVTFSSHGYKCRGGSSRSKAKNNGPGCPGK